VNGGSFERVTRHIKWHSTEHIIWRFQRVDGIRERPRSCHSRKGQPARRKGREAAIGTIAPDEGLGVTVGASYDWDVSRSTIAKTWYHRGHECRKRWHKCAEIRPVNLQKQLLVFEHPNDSSVPTLVAYC